MKSSSRQTLQDNEHKPHVAEPIPLKAWAQYAWRVLACLWLLVIVVLFIANEIQKDVATPISAWLPRAARLLGLN